MVTGHTPRVISRICLINELTKIWYIPHCSNDQRQPGYVGGLKESTYYSGNVWQMWHIHIGINEEIRPCCIFGIYFPFFLLPPIDRRFRVAQLQWCTTLCSLGLLRKVVYLEMNNFQVRPQTPIFRQHTELLLNW